MRPVLDILCELFRLCAQQHGMLKLFLTANAENWGDIAVRRKARLGLAVVTSMLRRLIHLLAREQVLPPLRIRSAPPPPLPHPGLPASPLPEVYCQSDAPRRRFRLIETPRERPARTPNPCPVPDGPALTHALFMERAARLAEAWRARHRIARRLARRVQSAAAPRLRALCLPAQIHARAPHGVLRFLDCLQACLDHPDTS